MTDLAKLHLDDQGVLLVVLREGCKYCTASMPFYQRLLATEPRRPVIAVGYEATETLESYASLHRVKFDNTVSVTPEHVKARVTPTLILLDGTGRVQKVWRGQLRSRTIEDEVVDAIAR